MKPDDQVFATLIQHYQRRVEQALDHWLPPETVKPVALHQAMRYSALAPGKRIRPILVYATASTLGVDLTHLDGAAAAVEMIHAYSLIHDDLPAMDNDDLRRGRATCHIQFDEATAILAGDALQALAFYVLSQNETMASNTVRLRMIETLSMFSGSLGMAGGQATDLSIVGKPFNLTELEMMYNHKTGALIQTCILFATLNAQNLSIEKNTALNEYAKAIGLAFQIQDDILDITGDTQTMGKTQGSDILHKKPTFPALIGLDAAREKMSGLHRKALESLSIFDEEAEILRYIATWLVSRNH